MRNKEVAPIDPMVLFMRDSLPSFQNYEKSFDTSSSKPRLSAAFQIGNFEWRVSSVEELRSAIKRARNLSSASGEKVGGGKISMSPGTFILGTEEITVPANTHLTGAGQGITVIEGAGILTSSGDDNIHLSNFTVDSNNYGVQLIGSENSIVENLTITNSGGSGLQFYSSNTCFVRNNNLIDSFNYGLYIASGNNRIIAINNYLNGNGDDYIFDEGTGSVLTANIGSTNDSLQQTVISIDPYSTPSAESGFSNKTISSDSLFNGFLQSSGAQNNYVQWDVQLQPGTWSVSIMAKKATNMGIMSVSFDAGSSTEGTIDWYNGSDSVNNVQSVTGITVDTAKTYQLRLTMSSKNASSSSYVGRVQSLKLLKTS